MNKIDKLKIFLQKNYPNEQAFNTRNWIGDNMETVYNEDGIMVDYCYNYGYIEIFGLTDEEFEDLIQYCNQRSVELSLMRAEFNREARLVKRKK